MFLIPNWQGEFGSYQNWVARARGALSPMTGSVGEPVSAICVDALGRRCHSGADFRRAEIEGAYPVRYFWDCVASAVDRDTSDGRWVDLPGYEEAGLRVSGALSEAADWAMVRVMARDLRALFDEIQRLRRLHGQEER